MKPAGLILSTSLFAFVTPASAAPPVVMARTAAAPAAQQNANDRLVQLFKESDERSIRRNQLQAMLRRDYRYADRLGDLFSNAHAQGEKAAAERDLAALH